jgi:hypothetical protein
MAYLHALVVSTTAQQAVHGTGILEEELYQLAPGPGVISGPGDGTLAFPQATRILAPVVMPSITLSGRPSKTMNGSTIVVIERERKFVGCRELYQMWVGN